MGDVTYVGDGSSPAIPVEHSGSRPPSRYCHGCKVAPCYVHYVALVRAARRPQRCALTPGPVAVTTGCEADHAMCMAD